MSRSQHLHRVSILLVSARHGSQCEVKANEHVGRQEDNVTMCFVHGAANI